MNNYAVSSDGIATALQDSASALMEAGNNLEQSVALVAAANKVVQDPNSVGSALRTISLRLRGTSVKVLEEMGEETDGAVESVSKMQEKLKALTGVDILTDSGAYKDTYTILYEIGEVWDSMSNIDQAAALELMAGKNRANTLAAILNNTEDLRDAYLSAMEAEGSALKENETYLDSIEGKTMLFKNALQNMWANAIPDDVIKGFIEFGTVLIKIIDTLGLIPTLLGAVTGYSITKGFLDAGSGSLPMHKKIQDIINAQHQETAAKQQNTAATNQNTAAATKNAEAKAKEAQETMKNAQANAQDAGGHDAAAAAAQRETQANHELAASEQIETNESLENANVNNIDRAAHDGAADAAIRESIAQSGGAGSNSTNILYDNQEIAEEIFESNFKDLGESITGNAVEGISKGLSDEASQEIAEEIFDSMYAPIAESVIKNGVEEVGEEIAETGIKKLFKGIASKLGGSAIGKAFSGIAAKLGSSLIGKIFGSIAGGIIGGLAVSAGTKIISAIVGVIDKKVMTSIEAEEISNDAIIDYKDKQKELEKQSATVKELSSAYQRLSSGVDTTTNTNIGLTTESYAEYLNVCNQIAEMYPELVTGYDAQGNAILSLKEKVDQLNKSYEEAKANAVNQFLSDDNKKAAWKVYQDKVINDRNDVVLRDGTSYNIDSEKRKKVLEAINTMSYNDLYDFYNYDKNGDAKQWDVLRQRLQEIGEYTNDVEMMGAYNSFNIKTFDSLDEYRVTLRKHISEVNQDIATGMNGIKELLSAKLIFDSTYNSASFGDESRAIVDSIMNNISPEMIYQSGADNVDDFYDWFSTNVIDKIANGNYQHEFENLSNISNEITKAIFDNDEDTFKAKTSYFNELFEHWMDSAGDIQVDPNADFATQYLQKMAKEIQEKSKNYTVKLQMRADLESDYYDVYDLIENYTGSDKEIIKGELGQLYIDEVQIEDVYEQISSGLADKIGNDGILRTDELKNLYDEYINNDFATLTDKGWEASHIASMKNLLSILKLYNTDIDTAIAMMLEFGYVQKSVSDMWDFNFALEDTQEKITEFESMISKFKEAWNSLNDGDMTESEFLELAMEFPELIEGVDFTNDNWMIKARENLEKLNNTKIDAFLKNLEEAKERALSEGKDTSAIDSMIGYVNQIKNQPLLDVELNTDPDTISGLTEVFETYKTVLEETNEVLYDGQKVSESYYNSLKEYINDTDELNSCFDRNNKRIVTNATKLKDLINQQKKETLQTTRVARAQSQLKYKNLVLQLYNTMKAYDGTTEAGREEINSLLDQIDTTEDAILKYKQLELSLLGATNAFEEFQKAQTIDSETDYETNVEEMIAAIGEGFDTGKVGTEAFNAAIKGVLPESVYGNLSDTEDLDKVWSEFREGNLSKFFTYSKDDGFSITLDNMKNFVEAAQNVKDEFGNQTLLDGDSFDNFNIVERLDGTTPSLKEFAAAMGLSEDATYAFLEMLTDYSIGGETLVGKLSDVKFDKDIEDATENLSKLLKKKKELLESGDYDDSTWTQLLADIEEVQKALEKANKDAADYADKYSTLTLIRNWQSGGIELTDTQVQGLAKHLSAITGTEYTVNLETKQLQTAGEKVVDIKTWLDELGSKPTILQIQTTYEQLHKDLEELEKKKLQTSLKTNVEFALDGNGKTKEQALAEIDEQIAVIENQIGVLELNYNLVSEEDEDGINTVVHVDTTEVDQAKEKIQQPTTSTHTINVQTGTVSVDTPETSTNTGVTLDYQTGPGYEEVLQDHAKLVATTSVPITQYVEADDKETIPDISSELDSLDKITIKNKKFSVTAIGINDVVNKLEAIKNNLQSINGMVAQATINITATENGDGGVNGTAHFMGTAHRNGSWGAPKTETALVGELGPELLVRGNRWQTIGEHGAEFTQIRRGDIIFNHRQTEDLLSKGYVTGRGKMVGGAFAQGTAYNTTYTDPYGWISNQSGSYGNPNNDLSDVENSLENFEDAFDWIEVRLEEINETLELMSARLENAVGYSEKNAIIEEMIATNKILLTNLQAGATEYLKYANKILSEIPSKYHDAVKNGAIAIEEFAGDADEKTLEKIQEYREWAQKYADLAQQAEELITTISDLGKQKFDNISEQFENEIGLIESANEKLESQVSLMEDRGYVAATEYYESMIGNTRNQIDALENEKELLQSVLDEQVRLGHIEKYSNTWYEMVDAIYEVDASIVECITDIEDFQNSINDIYWDNFDELINRIEYLEDETQNLIDLMDSDDLVITPETENGWSSDEVLWSDEGIASLGLYAQQMEIAEYKARQYANAIDDLNQDYADGKYSETEYLEKLNELTSAQYDSIEAYYDAQEAIKDLNEARIDAIKEGINKEIEAYEKLINKKKEALNSEKDLYDFQKNIADQQKEIAIIERKLAAIANDNSASARAKRAQLEAELLEARQALEDSYYDRSVSNQQDALDKELENFKEEKDKEIEELDKYLEDIESIVADSLEIIRANATVVYDTLQGKAEEYNLTLSDSIMTPWQDGVFAVSDYQNAFDTAMSSTMNQLDALKDKWQEVIDAMTAAARIEIEAQQNANNEYTSAVPTQPNGSTTPNTTAPAPSNSNVIAVGGRIHAGSAFIYSDSSGGGAGTQYYANDPIYTVLQERNGYLLVRHHSLSSGYTGWFRKSDVRAYAKGTTGVKKDQLALIDELGEELRLVPDGNGRLAYLAKGTGVIPADLTANLMEWGAMDPSDMLSRNKPQIGISPSVVNNAAEINIDASVGELIHVEHLDGNNPSEITKIVDKAWDKRMKELNGFVRKYSR